MYAYLDRAVGELAEPDIFIVSALRGWVTAARSGRCACAALQHGFRLRGVTEAVRSFAVAMATIDADAIDLLRFAPVCAPHITDDEARLLALFAAGRGETSADLRRLAATMVTEDAVAQLEGAVRLVGCAMMGDAA